MIEASTYLSDARKALKALIKAQKDAYAIEDAQEQAHAYYDIVMPAMEALREPIDKAEMIVDKDMWPVPSYGDLMFEV